MVNAVRPLPLLSDDDPTEENVLAVVRYFFDSISHGQIADQLYRAVRNEGRMRRLRVDRVRRVCDRLLAKGLVTRSGVEYEGIHWVSSVLDKALV